MININKETCKHCNGKGMNEYSRDGMYEYMDTCGMCSGKGYKLFVYDDSERLGELILR